MLFRRYSMEHRTTCLGCLDAANSKAPFDKEGECDRCEKDVTPHTSIIDNEYFKCAIRSALFRDYVAHSIVKATCIHIPLRFMDRFMEEVARAGRCESAEPWDQEGPRVVCGKNLLLQSLKLRSSNEKPVEISESLERTARGGCCYS